jgi:hypothetical protein
LPIFGEIQDAICSKSNRRSSILLVFALQESFGEVEWLFRSSNYMRYLDKDSLRGSRMLAPI